ncbi:MAG: protein kinase family protein [Bacillota bacterium]
MRHNTELLQSYDALAKSVVFVHGNQGVSLVDYNKVELTPIGYGRSAYVFKISGSNRVLKVFYPPFEDIATKEAEIYQSLKGNSYYPTLYGYGENYLVIDHIEGLTLFECLVHGRKMNERHVVQIDEALGMARERGLNPSDIHLHNIIITPTDEVKLIDVARFRQEKLCTQWEDIKTVFFKYYIKKYFPKKWPALVLYFIAALYKKKLLTRFY